MEYYFLSYYNVELMLKINCENPDREFQKSRYDFLFSHQQEKLASSGRLDELLLLFDVDISI